MSELETERKTFHKLQHLEKAQNITFKERIYYLVTSSVIKLKNYCEFDGSVYRCSQYFINNINANLKKASKKGLTSREKKIAADAKNLRDVVNMAEDCIMLKVETVGKVNANK